jgi:DNA polymerase-1
VQLVDDVKIQTPLDDLRLREPDGKVLVAFLKALEFTTLTRRVAEVFDVDAAEVDPEPALLGANGWRGRNGEILTREEPEAPAPAPTASDALTPAALAKQRIEAAPKTPVDHSKYIRIDTMEKLSVWIAEAFDAGFVCFDTETDSLDPMQANLVGLSLALAPNRAGYIPFGHKQPGADDLFGGGELSPGQLPLRPALEALRPLLTAPSVLKIAQNVKYDWLVLAQHGVEVGPVEDTMLASYTLDAGLNGHGMDELSLKILEHRSIPFSEVAGQGKSFIGFARVAVDKAVEYSAEDADVTLRLWNCLQPRLVAESMTTVYETLERPLAVVLAKMERRGICVDRALLSRLSGEFAQDMARLEAEVQSLAGESFNLGSPKQLGDILFGKFGLPGGKKTATGAWSTSASVLDELAEGGNDLAARILEWRQVQKLRSTYAEALPRFINPTTGRVHTSYSMAATSTGRLSSSEPNLQNIPVRNEAGRKLRRAFVAAPGKKLISADYSQIELRLLAHIADIPQLKQAFAEGKDIHAITASEIFGVPVEGMPSDVRRRAKAINFGIVYGISAFGLANQLGISREEAGAYIKLYFERFPGIRAYMDATKKLCREQGFVTTLFGRKCHYPRIGSSNASERAFNERAAVNAPIQGAAADIIRRAMIRMDDALAAARLSAQMLLQVHDELVFEAPEAEVADTLACVRKVMEQAALPAVHLSVPLLVEARAADNWDEAH